MPAKGKLTFFAGKMGAGKSTQSLEVARRSNAVLLSEDEWLAAIYPQQITTLGDYIQYSNLLKLQIKRLVQSILLTGSDVVMDFPANTLAQRQWFKGIFTEIDAPHQLIYIDLPDADCLKRIEQRRISQPNRAKTDTKVMFEAVTKHFVVPLPSEGFDLVVLSL